MAEAVSLNYIDSRLEDQIKFFSRKSRINKNYYQRIKIIEIIISVLIPSLIGYVKSFDEIKYIISALGIILAILSSLQILYKFHDKWINYRSTSESLKQEKYMFLSQAGPYKITTNMTDLVERVETILAKENSTWNQLMNKKEDKK